MGRMEDEGLRLGSVVWRTGIEGSRIERKDCTTGTAGNDVGRIYQVPADTVDIGAQPMGIGTLVHTSRSKYSTLVITSTNVQKKFI